MAGVSSKCMGVAGAVWLALALPAGAADLRIGLSAPVASMDPHFLNASPNIGLSRNIFETLVQMDPDSRIVPGLAESWRQVDDATWEFKLRQATFSDGSPVTAADVVWSLDRPATVTGSVSPFTIYTRPIVGKTAVDDRTVQLKTAGAYPLLLADLTNIFVVSRKATEGAGSEQFMRGQAVIGSGPYKFVSFTPDDRVQLTANERYWGGKPAWDNVTLRFLTNDTARLTALVTGDVDAIENVPPADLEKARADAKLTVAAKKSHRLVFLFLDGGRDVTPGVAALDGSPLKTNPLKDVRVRRAVNMAIDRKAIADRLMQGLAYPTTNLVTETMEGFDPALEKVPFDPNGARALLAEAGFKDGFALTIGTPNNRLINDAKVTQAIAQMLTRVGIKTAVDAVPFSVINTRGGKGEFSSVLMGWGAQTAEASSPLRAMIACANKERGWGAVNWSNYCNPDLDRLLGEAIATVDKEKRSALLRQASDVVAKEVAIVPLYFQATTWAARKGIAITPRTDERTSALVFAP